MNATQKFIKRLRTELDLKIPQDAYAKRTYAGRHQRAAGAWTTTIRSRENTVFEIGIWQPIAKLLKCPKLEAYDYYGLSVDCGCPGGKCRGIK